MLGTRDVQFLLDLAMGLGLGPVLVLGSTWSGEPLRVHFRGLRGATVPHRPHRSSNLTSHNFALIWASSHRGVTEVQQSTCSPWLRLPLPTRRFRRFSCKHCMTRYLQELCKLSPHMSSEAKSAKVYAFLVSTTFSVPVSPWPCAGSENSEHRFEFPNASLRARARPRRPQPWLHPQCPSPRPVCRGRLGKPMQAQAMETPALFHGLVGIFLADGSRKTKCKKTQHLVSSMSSSASSASCSPTSPW